jgi:hypothetical protein
MARCKEFHTNSKPNALIYQLFHIVIASLYFFSNTIRYFRRRARTRRAARLRAAFLPLRLGMFASVSLARARLSLLSEKQSLQCSRGTTRARNPR